MLEVVRRIDIWLPFVVPSFRGSPYFWEADGRHTINSEVLVSSILLLCPSGRSEAVELILGVLADRISRLVMTGTRGEITASALI